MSPVCSDEETDEDEVEAPDFDEDDEEEEDEDDEDEDPSYEGEKKQKQSRKSRERREKLNANILKGRRVDTTGKTFKLGEAARSSSHAGRSLLEKVHSKGGDQIRTTTETLENASSPSVSLTGVPPFVTLAALKNARTVPTSLTSIKTGQGTLSRGTNQQRRGATRPGPQRLSTTTVPALGSYASIASSSSNTNNNAERLLESLESERDRSSGETTHIKRKLREARKISKKQQKDPEQDTSVMELIGASEGNPDIETLKTQNVGNTIELLDQSDVQLATTSTGQPVLGSSHYSSLSNLSQKPGSPTREENALLSSFRLARESEQLSGLRSPTREELQEHSGFSTTWQPPTREKKNKKAKKKSKGGEPRRKTGTARTGPTGGTRTTTRPKITSGKEVGTPRFDPSLNTDRAVVQKWKNFRGQPRASLIPNVLSAARGT